MAAIIFRDISRTGWQKIPFYDVKVLIIDRFVTIRAIFTIPIVLNRRVCTETRSSSVGTENKFVSDDLLFTLFTGTNYYYPGLELALLLVMFCG